jgi:CRISPR-associated protein Cas2
MEQSLLDEVDLEHDNLRIYQLLGPKEHSVREFGRFRATDFQDPLIV